tara:strand:- start:152 stop:616 length:465 start_codon:yes stop_codon:yes gene_type:complete
MKKIKLLIAMLTIVAIAKGGSITLNKDTIYTWQEFVSAVIMVESTNNPKAYNKRENAVGILQIRPIMVREVNRVLKMNNSNDRYTLLDRWSKEKSIDMFEIMAENVRCCEDMTRLEFYERVARKWNGGYRGMEKTATIKYWNNIKKELIKFGKQ